MQKTTLAVRICKMLFIPRRLLIAAIPWLLFGPLNGENVESPLRPYQEIDGQRFWHSGDTSRYFKLESKKLYASQKLPNRKDILEQLKSHAQCSLEIPSSPPEKSASVYDTLARATVLIMTHDEKNGDRFGTGFFIAPGVIVSNWHVVDTAIDFPMIAAMTYDGEVFPITAGLAGNKSEDLVILKAQSEGKHFTCLPLASKLPTPGTSVWQCGHTHAAYWTFTDGIINRYCIEPFKLESEKKSHDHPVIDLSHKVSAGSSGSPVVNDRAEVVGIYHHRRWYNQTEKNFVEPKNNKIEESKRPVIQDRVVLFERNLALPVTTLGAMIKQP